jgi:mono/diheme cytochrome c family protein
MPEALATVDPKTALSVGLKVDAESLPGALVDSLKKGQVDLGSPKTTLELLKLNAVVGVKGEVSAAGTLTRVGVTCALCHSTVDNSFSPGIGKRLDGWANRDLNVGAIIALSPALDEATKKEFRSWGPGKYDPRHHAFNGSKLVPLNSPSLPIVIPSIYGLKNVGFETVTGDGPISYWNSYVAVGQMGGHGSFTDARIGLTITQTPDQVTPKLKPLLEYQLSLRTPKAATGSFDAAAAKRGEQVFRGAARCASCHAGDAFTDVGRAHDTPPQLHEPSEVGTDARYAQRSATKKFRTTPLRALWQHPPYFHDGSAADLPAVVDHYTRHLKLNLKAEEKKDLVEFLKSL